MLQPRGFPETRSTLLADLRDGASESGWREFFNCYAPAVFRISRLRGLDRHDSDDIVQQVMASICASISTFRYDRRRGRFRQWVRRVTERKILNHRRRRRPRPAEAEWLEAAADAAPTLDELWKREWQIQDILWCIDGIAQDISPRRMTAFRRYVLEGRSASETSKELGMTVGYVYATRNQVLNMIRSRMAALEADDAENRRPTNHD